MAHARLQSVAAACPLPGSGCIGIMGVGLVAAQSLAGENGFMDVLDVLENWRSVLDCKQNPLGKALPQRTHS